MKAKGRGDQGKTEDLEKRVAYLEDRMSIKEEQLQKLQGELSFLNKLLEKNE